mmetsp:Transcript_26472/g.76441  ORF Transcript_26472/g.76441 Transcript_26472/m.76441 type:complete len:354 (-) Transcript_26472:355-1416(-)
MPYLAVLDARGCGTNWPLPGSTGTLALRARNGGMVLRAEEYEVHCVGLLQAGFRVGAAGANLREVSTVKYCMRNAGCLRFRDHVLRVFDAIVLQAEPQWAFGSPTVEVRIISLPLDLLQDMHDSIAGDLPKKVRKVKLMHMTASDPPGQSLQRLVADRVLVQFETVALRPFVEERRQVLCNPAVRNVGIAGQIDVEDVVAMLLGVALHEAIEVFRQSLQISIPELGAAEVNTHGGILHRDVLIPLGRLFIPIVPIPVVAMPIVLLPVPEVRLLPRAAVAAPFLLPIGAVPTAPIVPVLLVLPIAAAAGAASGATLFLLLLALAAAVRCMASASSAAGCIECVARPTEQCLADR